MCLELFSACPAISWYFLVCSVVVREDKKLINVLFPDGRDGRAFTLKVDAGLDILSFPFTF